MPLEIDPAWEYWEPDPEIEYVMTVGRQATKYEMLDINPLRLRKRQSESGFRFGNPNGGSFRLSCREKKDRGSQKVLQPRECPACKTVFTPYRDSQVHCSRACYKPPGAVRVRAYSLECVGCGLAFEPKSTKQRFCSTRCAAPLGAPAPPSDEKLQRFAAMYVAGLSMAEMREEFGVSLECLKKWRRRCGLPARKPGNPNNRR